MYIISYTSVSDELILKQYWVKVTCVVLVVLSFTLSWLYEQEYVSVVLCHGEGTGTAGQVHGAVPRCVALRLWKCLRQPLCVCVFVAISVAATSKHFEFLCHMTFLKRVSPFVWAWDWHRQYYGWSGAANRFINKKPQDEKYIVTKTTLYVNNIKSWWKITYWYIYLWIC